MLSRLCSRVDADILQLCYPVCEFALRVPSTCGLGTTALHSHRIRYTRLFQGTRGITSGLQDDTRIKERSLDVALAPRDAKTDSGAHLESLNRYWYRPAWIESVHTATNNLISHESSNTRTEANDARPILECIEALARISGSSKSVTDNDVLDHIQILVETLKVLPEQQRIHALRKLRIVLARRRNVAVLRLLPDHENLRVSISEVLDPMLADWSQSQDVKEWTKLVRIHCVLGWYNPWFLGQSLDEPFIQDMDPYAAAVAVCEAVRTRATLPSTVWNALLQHIKCTFQAASAKDLSDMYRFLILLRPVDIELGDEWTTLGTCTDRDETIAASKGFSAWSADGVPGLLWKEVVLLLESKLWLQGEDSVKMRWRLLRAAKYDSVAILSAQRQRGDARIAGVPAGHPCPSQSEQP